MQLRDSAHRARADRRAGRQVGEDETVAGDERVPRILALRDGGDVQPRVLRGGQVLVGVHGEVDLLRDQRVAQRGDEDPDAELSDRRGGAVTRGDDPDQLDRAAGGSGQRIGDELGLGERKSAASSAEAKRCSCRRLVLRTARRIREVQGTHACPPISGTASALVACGTSRSNSSRSRAAY
jgi:hypothetical protein